MRGPVAAQSPAMKQFFIRLALALTFAALAGCNSDKPGLVGFKPELLKIERDGHGGATAIWQIVNPNIATYNVAESSHKIFVNGRYLGRAVTKEPTGVPRQTNITQSAPIALERDGAAILDAAGNSGAYRIESSLLLLIYSTTTEKFSVTNAGTVRITGK